MRSHAAKRPTLVLAEDHAAVAAYLAEEVRGHFDVVGVVTDGEALIALARKPP
jgi:CheY-like chemotaxis protein